MIQCYARKIADDGGRVRSLTCERGDRLVCDDMHLRSLSGSVRTSLVRTERAVLLVGLSDPRQRYGCQICEELEAF